MDFVFGIVIASVVWPFFFWLNYSPDDRILSGSEFMIKNSIYKCEVSHKLIRNKN